LSGQVLLRTLRETQILVCHPEDRDGEELVRHLGRIGCRVRRTWPAPKRIPEGTDVVFLLFERNQQQPDTPCEAAFALVAVIDYEDPAMLNTLIDKNVRGVVTKPIRPFGVLSTLLTARASHRYEGKLRQKVAKLEETLRSRREIERSVKILMNARSISEEAAYQMIRREAMQRRQSMALVASSIISAYGVLERFAPGPDAPAETTDN
jgi:AmiR/NasT family two-component response regulator